MATIYDIANLSNTSIATVSYVLNGNGDKHRISKATQEKILAVAESLNYRPNTSAKRLSTDKQQRLSIALFWPNCNFEQAIISTLRAVNDLAKLSTEEPELSIQFYEPGCLSDKMALLTSQAYNGIILSGAGENDLAFLSEHKPATPLVLVNRTLEGFPSVSIDHARAGRLACDLAYGKGGDSVTSVWEQQYHVATNQRYTAFTERCAELGIDLSGKQFYCDGTEEDGYAVGIRMAQKKQISKVIFCNHEGIARGLLTALNEFGVAVGQDVFLLTTSVGPSSLCRFCSPSITSIDLKMQAVAENALKLCLGLMSRQADPQTTITLQPEVVFRDSFPTD